jgi:cytochrome P450
MLSNPGAFAKAQAELDTVLGPGQLPNFGDEASLPYVAAVVMEVMRWRPVTPIGTFDPISGEMRCNTKNLLQPFPIL